MAIIANLDIVLGAQTAKVTRGLNDTRAQLQSLQRTVVGFAAAWLSFHAAQQATAALLARAEAVDALGKQARLMGETTERLQAVALAGKLAGSSQEDLFAAINRANRVVGAAAAGAKHEAEALRMIGLSVSDLAALSPAERLFAIGAALQRQGNAAAIAHAANTIFGRGWANIVGTISQGNDTLQDALDKLRGFGGTISEADVRKIEAANDALTLVKAQLQSLATRALPVFAAGLSLATKALDRLLAMSRAFSGTEAPAATVRIIAYVAAIVSITFIVSRVIRAIAQIVAAIKTLTAAQSLSLALSGPKGWAILAIGAGIAVGAIAGVEAAYASMNAELEKMTAEGERGAAVSDALREAMAGVADVDLDAPATSAAKAAEEAKRKYDELVDRMKSRGEDLRRSLRTPLEEFRDTLVELQELAKFNAIGGETATRAVEEALQRLRDASGDRGGQVLNVGSARRGTAEALSPFLQRVAPDSTSQRQLAASQEAAKTLKKIETILRAGGPTIISTDLN